MARRHKRLWTDEEKRSICSQTTAPGVSVAQVAQRYALNANLVFKWLRDPRYKPGPVQGDDVSTEEARFLPVEIIDGDDGSGPDAEDPSVVADVEGSEYDGVLEVDLAYGPRLRVKGAYDAEALALLIRRLSA